MVQEQQTVTETEQPPKKSLLPFSASPIKPKKKRGRRWLILLLVIIAAVFLLRRCFGGKTAPTGGMSLYQNAVADRGDINVTLSGSGALQPADSYTVTTLISGEILEDGFEEGDMVEKDQLLYQVDSSSLSNAIERAELSLSQSETNYQRSQENLSDLNVKSPAAGTVTELLAEVGDSVSAGDILARVVNRDTMSLVLPFPADDAAHISVGQSAQVVLEGTFETLTGTVTKVSGADQVLAGNRIVRNVTIQVQNPGALTDTAAATASVGDYACTAASSFTYESETVVTAPASGDVTALLVKEGAHVDKNQALVAIQSSSVSDQVQNAYISYRDAQISLENQYEQLENYTIKSPIQGTVVEKIYKAGDTLESGKNLCTIYDLSYLTMTLYVDELDIGQLEIGQPVRITADALPGQEFTGKVTTISIKGTTSNGVTTYPVTIRIDEPDSLLPGMNVDCEIDITHVSDVVRIPARAVSRGNQVLVLTGENTGGIDETTGLPAGFTYQEVTVGVSDGDFVEITSGLEAGDTIAYIPTSGGDNFFFMGGPGGPGGAQVVVVG